MLAGKAAERLEAEAELRIARRALMGEAAMLRQANEELAGRVTKLSSANSIAESLAESRLRDSDEMGLRVCAT